MGGSVDASVVAAVATEMRNAESILFVTGAGISADSGLPTYRGIGGLYERAVTEEGVPIEDVLSGRMLRANPGLCWKYIAQIESACRGARPNRAHEILAGLERERDRCWVLTQNVDGLHRSAGSRNVIEIHGNIHRLLCTGCGHRQQVVDFQELELPPKCPRCRGAIRPEVVLFGEMLPAQAVAAMQQQLRQGFDLVCSIGTTSAFPYIAEPVILARRQGRTTIEINPGTSEVSAVVDHRIRAGAVAAMEAIVASL